MHLLDELSDLGLGGTGTIRESRVPKTLETWRQAEMNKMERGAKSSIYSSDKVIVRWRDNKAVSVASKVYGVEPVHEVKRWSCHSVSCNGENAPSPMI